MKRTTRRVTPDATAIKLADLLAQVIGQAVLFNESVARTVGLSASDLQAFGLIARQDGPTTATKLGKQTGLPASTVTRVLDRLEQGGYISRGAVPTDRRKIAIKADPTKASGIALHYRSKIQQVAELNSRRTHSEVAAVISYLDDLAASGSLSDVDPER